jgi:hypothetical protein
MAIEHALAALPQHWDDVVARLGRDKTGQLRGYIAALEGPGRKRAVARIADLMVDGLPAGHPVRRALVSGDLLAPPVLDWAVLTGPLLDLAADQPGTEEHPGESILGTVARRVLREPALTAADVRRRGADPADDALIRLDLAEGGERWPAFQFAPDGGPWPVVREINRLLGAAAYPLGAADWWLSRNGWLGERPSQLIGRVPDDELIQAALAIRSEV